MQFKTAFAPISKSTLLIIIVLIITYLILHDVTTLFHWNITILEAIKAKNILVKTHFRQDFNILWKIENEDSFDNLLFLSLNSVLIYYIVFLLLLTKNIINLILDIAYILPSEESPNLPSSQLTPFQELCWAQGKGLIKGNTHSWGNPYPRLWLVQSTQAFGWN